MSRSDRKAALTPAEFHILMALADGERHGYGIMQEVSGGDSSIRLGPGTLYRSIKRLLNDALIDESEGRPDPDPDDERRRYYRLTARGRAMAEDEATRLEKLVHIARSKRLIPVPALAKPEVNR